MSKRIFILIFIFCSIQFVFSQCDSNQIDINTASLSDLDKLTGIGPAKAQAIIDARFYSSIDDLVNANGIGPSTLVSIKSQGLACVDSGSVQKETTSQADSSTKTTSLEISQIAQKTNFEPPTIQEQSTAISLEQPNESVINLNSDTIKEGKITYETRNGLVKEYAIYAFALFLAIVILVLLLRG